MAFFSNPLQREAAPHGVVPTLRAVARGRDSTASTPPDGYDIRLFSDLNKAEHDWRRLEEQGHGSVYQTYDWCASWCDVFIKNERSKPCIVIGYIEGEPSVLLPLYRTTNRLGLRNLKFIGDHHANIRLPMVHEGRRAAADDWLASGAFLNQLRHLCRAEGVADHITLACMAKRFAGQPNTLIGARAAVCHDAIFTINLRDDFDQLMNERRGKAYKKKFRSKTRALEQIGPIRFSKAQSADEIESALRLFFEQKRVRFNELRLFNRFVYPDDRRFLLELARQSYTSGRPSLEVYCLNVGDEKAAIFATGRFRNTVSGAVHSMTSAKQIAERSPGEVILNRLIKTCCEEGVEQFDLGFGDARYKQAWCDTGRLYDVSTAVTVPGHLIAIAHKFALRTRRVLLRSPRVAEVIRRVRYSVMQIRRRLGS
ncbi:MAG: GNAT family N-acetyltransferase [Pseudomonadota bacterium]